MGGADTVGGTVAPYTHTIGLATGDLPYYTIQRAFAQGLNTYAGTAFYAENYLDAKFNDLTLSGKSGDLITAKVTFNAGNIRAAVGGTPAAPITGPTFDSDAPYMFWNGSVVMTVAGGAQGGTPTAGLSTFDVVFANQVDETYKFGKALPAVILPKVRKVTGKVAVLIDSFDQYYTGVYGISSNADPDTTNKTGSMTMTLNSTSVLGVNTNNSLQVTMPVVSFHMASVKLDPQGKIMEQEVDFEAQINSGNDEFAAVITNQTATAF